MFHHVCGCFGDDDSKIAGLGLVKIEIARNLGGGAPHFGRVGALLYANEKIGFQRAP
jgi:hypothetical protein